MARQTRERPFEVEIGKRRQHPSASAQIVQDILGRKPEERPAPPADTIEWLKWLDADIWIEHPPTYNSYGSVMPYRGLTEDEKTRVLSAIDEHKLITMMGSGTFGLSGYSMSMYVHPIYPGLKPTYLLCVGHEHWYGMEHRRDKDPHYNHLWELFSKHTHSEQNRQWLKTYGFDPPRDRVHYDY